MAAANELTCLYQGKSKFTSAVPLGNCQPGIWVRGEEIIAPSQEHGTHSNTLANLIVTIKDE
jgi:hypothetical protein